MVALKRYKDQKGIEVHDIVKQFFFLWEIIQKLFFLAWGFHILETRNNIFCHPGGPNRSLGGGGLLAFLRAKKTLLAQMSIKIKVY